MKIAFVGDSYCADFGPDSYLNIVLRHFTSRRDAKLICTGLKGMALYHSYETLLTDVSGQRGISVIDASDYIVFCITSRNRLATRHTMPCMPGLLDYYLDPAQDIDSQVPLGNTTELDDFLEHYLLAPAPVKGKGKEKGRKILKTAKDFYLHLYNDQYMEAIQVGLLMQMDQLMVQNKKKCIWFKAAPNAFGDTGHQSHFIPASGPYGSDSLDDISQSEENAPGFDILCREGDVRDNHLSVENNLTLANLIINIIETDNFNPYEIDMSPYFNILKTLHLEGP